MNNVMLSGYLNYTKASKTSTGKTKTVGNLAVYRGKENNTTIYDYIRFNSYEEIADKIEEYGDGSEVILCGSLRHQKYEEQGQTKYMDFVLVNKVGLVKRKVQEEPTFTEDYEQMDIDPNDLPF